MDDIIRSQLATAFRDGACLLDTAHSSVSPSNLQSVLEARLSQYFSQINSPRVFELETQKLRTLEDVQLLTAQESLSVLRRIQKILGLEDSTPETSQATSSQPPAVGARDLGQLRTLISIVCNWGLNPLFSKVSQFWNQFLESNGRGMITETSPSGDDLEQLSLMTLHCLSLLFPDGDQGPVEQTFISMAMLNRHLADLLRPGIALGWLPRNFTFDGRETRNGIRSLVIRILAITTPAQLMVALGTIIVSTPSPPPHVSKTCASLLTRQLLRPEGVLGLCEAVFGGELDDVDLEKLEHFARTLVIVPSKMAPSTYFAIIVPRIIHLVSDTIPASYRRAGSFALYRMLAADGSFLHQDMAESIVKAALHDPFLLVPAIPLASESTTPPMRLSPPDALSVIVTLLLNSDPSPVLISSLLSPILPALYSLSYHLERHKTSDPRVKESLRGILVLWGKITDSLEATQVLWRIVEHGNGEMWSVGLESDFWRVAPSGVEPPSFSLMMPDDRNEEKEEFNLDSNLFNLYPDPAHFVQFLKEADRGDVSSDLFVTLLEKYRDQRLHPSSDPMQTLLYLQIITQMQMHLSEGTTSNILKKTTHLLTFIKHVLEPTAAPAPSRPFKAAVSPTVDLMLPTTVNSWEDDLDRDSDSDDEKDPSSIGPDDDIIETAVNLLLSVLEANDSLCAHSSPILNDIFNLLEPLARDSSLGVRPLAQEARLVITARFVSESTKSIATHSKEEKAQDIYQKALRLLQDPILPVRAHGLLLLRQLVSPPSPGLRGTPAVKDPALVPAILSIFLQSIRDDDSYIFLNAVQGLAVMVDTFGKDVLKGLLGEYAGGLNGLNVLTNDDLDVRIRVGEALSIVIKRCGEALGIFADILIPPLQTIIQSHHLPTVLRTSSLSILSDCISICPLAVFPYINGLSEAMIDLLQVETVSMSNSRPPDKQDGSPRKTSTSTDADISNQEMENQPLSTNSKLPPLRRAGLQFLVLLIRRTTSQLDGIPIQEAHSALLLPGSLLKRASITFGYLISTDEDDVVRVMAREGKESLEQLQRALLGID